MLATAIAAEETGVACPPSDLPPVEFDLHRVVDDLVALVAEGRSGLNAALVPAVVQALKATIEMGDLSARGEIIRLAASLGGVQQMWVEALGEEDDRVVLALLDAGLPIAQLLALIWHHSANYNVVFAPALAALKHPALAGKTERLQEDARNAGNSALLDAMTRLYQVS